MSKLPVEKRFQILCQITRAQHFAWRQAVAEMAPGLDPAAVVDRMWEITGRGTAASYAKRIDPSADVARQVADGIAWSSQCMGEDAAVEVPVEEPAEASRAPGEVLLRHRDCPWVHWHRRQGLERECRPGCDAWFASTLRGVSAAIGAEVRFETLEALPEGGESCLRRIWSE